MTNQVFIIGRLVRDPKLEELESGKKVSTITLGVSRSYKNAEGVYETDFIDCTLWHGIAENTCEYCRKGDLVGVKGRLETVIEDDGDGHYTKKELRIIADKVTFLSSTPRNTNEDNA